MISGILMFILIVILAGSFLSLCNWIRKVWNSRETIPMIKDVPSEVIVKYLQVTNQFNLSAPNLVSENLMMFRLEKAYDYAAKKLTKDEVSSLQYEYKLEESLSKKENKEKVILLLSVRDINKPIIKKLHLLAQEYLENGK